MNKKIEEAIRHFWKARKDTIRIQALSEGWETDTLNPEIFSESALCLFVKDYRKDFLWQCIMPLKTFNQAAEITAKATESFQNDVFAGVGKALDERIKNSKTYLEVDVDSFLAVMVAHYAGATKAWAVAEKLKNGGAFFVIRYQTRDQARKADSDGNLRPFAIKMHEPKSRAEDYFAEFSANTIKATFNQVIEMDKRNHPEWF